MPAPDHEWVRLDLRTTAFYTDEYEKTLKERGVNEESRHAAVIWNTAGNKMEEEYQCQEQ